MENVVKEMINVSIGLIKIGEESFKTSISQAEKFFNDVKSKGEGDSSEQANQLRELLNKAIRDLNDLESNAKSNYQEFATKLENSYNEIASQIDQNLPDSVKDGLKTSIDQIKELIEKVKQDNVSESTPAAGSTSVEPETGSKKGKSKVKAA